MSILIIHTTDPFDFGNKFCKTAEAKLIMQTVEIFNGRTAMLATVGFVVQEAVTGNLPFIHLSISTNISGLFAVFLTFTSKYFFFISFFCLGLPVVRETPQFFQISQ